MLRFGLWTLRQRRYAALAVAMLIIAIGCVWAGTWQISRFNQNVRDNHALKANARAASVALTTSLVPLTGSSQAPGRDEIRYRTVSVEGRYIQGREQYLHEQQEHGHSGFYVVDPLRTSDGVLVVARGFVRATAAGDVPASVPAPPPGLVSVTGRLQTASTGNDQASELGERRIASVNAAIQAQRLDTAVFQAYLTLDTTQPSTAGLTVLPEPDLSNPAGGVVAPQHFAYIIQWYLFALLALAAPFIIARREVREAQLLYLGVGSEDEQFDLEYEEQFDAPLQLAGSPADALQQSGSERGDTGVVAVRSTGALARPDDISSQRWQRAEKLASRYDRSLGGGTVPLRPRRGRMSIPFVRGEPVSDSSAAVHRAQDEYHAAYNDYLWELSLADGSLPDLQRPQQSGGRPAVEPPAVQPSYGRDPRTIEHGALEHDAIEHDEPAD